MLRPNDRPWGSSCSGTSFVEATGAASLDDEVGEVLVVCLSITPAHLDGVPEVTQQEECDCPLCLRTQIAQVEQNRGVFVEELAEVESIVDVFAGVVLLRERD